MSDCRFGVSPVNYPDPDPGHELCASVNETFFLGGGGVRGGVSCPLVSLK